MEKTGRKGTSRRSFLKESGKGLLGTAITAGTAGTLISMLFPDAVDAQQQVIGIPRGHSTVAVQGSFVSNGVAISGSVFHRGGRTIVQTSIGNSFGVVGNPFLFTGFGVSPFFNPFWGINSFNRGFCGQIAYFSGLPHFYNAGQYYSFTQGNQGQWWGPQQDFYQRSNEYQNLAQQYEELKGKYEAFQKEYSDHLVADIEAGRQQILARISQQQFHHEEHPVAKQNEESEKKFTLESRYSGRVAHNQYDDCSIEAFNVFSKALEDVTNGSTRLALYDHKDNHIMVIRDKNRMNAGDSTILASIDVGTYDNCLPADVLVKKFLDDVKKTNVVSPDAFNKAYSKFGVAYDIKFDACA